MDLTKRVRVSTNLTSNFQDPTSRMSYLVFKEQSLRSDKSEEAPPVPMPNTEVKLFSADGNGGSSPVRVGRRCAIFYKSRVNMREGCEEQGDRGSKREKGAMYDIHEH